MSAIANRLINHPVFRGCQRIQRMVNSRGQGHRRHCEEEVNKARESGETNQRSIERHFGLTSGNKGGGEPLPPETPRPSRLEGTTDRWTLSWKQIQTAGRMRDWSRTT